MQHRLLHALIPAALLIPSLALAHGELPHADFMDGFAHPLAGLDHLLAMIAVGLLAGRMAIRRAWLVPASFVLAMVGGALLSRSGAILPAAEILIALSVITLGLAVVDATRLGLAAAASLVAFFALFHGYAHGLEARPVSFAKYTAGFVLSTAVLHAIGVGLYFGLRGSANRWRRAKEALARSTRRA